LLFVPPQKNEKPFFSKLTGSVEGEVVGGHKGFVDKQLRAHINALKPNGTVKALTDDAADEDGFASIDVFEATFYHLLQEAHSRAALKLHLQLDHQGYLPNWALETTMEYYLSVQDFNLETARRVLSEILRPILTDQKLTNTVFFLNRKKNLTT
jgi:hypothetical protein